MQHMTRRDRAAPDDAIAEGVEVEPDHYGISHVFEYRYAASRLLQSPVDDKAMLARPISYLARHALELALKHAVQSAEAEYHHGEVDYRPFETTRPGHDLKALLTRLNMLLNSTGNDPVPIQVREIVLKLHDLDPDGQRFRYGRALAKGREPVISLAKGTRIDLKSVVTDTEKAIDALFDLDPTSPREQRERAERIEALAATQHLPVHRVERDFGVRRSSDGLVLLPQSVAPGAKAGDMLRLMANDRVDLCWRVVRAEGRDYVLDWVDDSMRLPASMIARSYQRDECPVCGSHRIDAVASEPEETVVFEAGVVHGGDEPLMSAPDRYCRTCHHRFESRQPGTELARRTFRGLWRVLPTARKSSRTLLEDDEGR